MEKKIYRTSELIAMGYPGKKILLRIAHSDLNKNGKIAFKIGESRNSHWFFNIKNLDDALQSERVSRLFGWEDEIRKKVKV